MKHSYQPLFHSCVLCSALLVMHSVTASESTTTSAPSMNSNTTNTTPTQTIAEGSNSLFRHSVTVKAPAQRIWAIWMDVANWPTWDTELKEATAATPLMLGTEGKITPQKGPSSSFKVVSFEPQTQYAFETPLPLAKLKVTRFLTALGDTTTFTHEVEFSGFAAAVFANQFGPVFRAALPRVMDKIAAQALLPQ